MKIASNANRAAQARLPDLRAQLVGHSESHTVQIFSPCEQLTYANKPTTRASTTMSTLIHTNFIIWRFSSKDETTDSLPFSFAL